MTLKKRYGDGRRLTWSSVLFAQYLLSPWNGKTCIIIDSSNYILAVFNSNWPQEGVPRCCRGRWGWERNRGAWWNFETTRGPYSIMVSSWKHENLSQCRKEMNKIWKISKIRSFPLLQHFNAMHEIWEWKGILPDQPALMDQHQHALGLRVNNDEDES